MGRDNHNRRGGRGAGRNNRRNYKNRGSNSGKSKPTSEKKTLADHKFYVGTAKQSADCIAATHFIINHIQKTHGSGEDMAIALETGQEFDFTQTAPKSQKSTATEDADKAHEEKQFELDYQADIKLHKDRIKQHRENRSARSSFGCGLSAPTP